MSINTNLGLCDMVLALPEDMINKQFSILHQRNIIHQNWNIVIFQDENGKITQVKTNQSIADFQTDIDGQEFAFAFSANLITPQISVIKDERKVVNFLIPFGKGTLYCWTGHGKASKLQQVDMTDWVYAFKTDIGSVEFGDSTKTPWITKESHQHFNNICAENRLPPSDFAVDSLFLDFENVNYSEYDQRSSSISSDLATVKIFQYLLSNYLRTFAKSGNPFILGYGIRVKRVVGHSLSLFQPTALRLSTSFNNNPRLSALNFLMMIGGAAFPRNQNTGVLPHSLVTSANKGKMVIDRAAFGRMFSATISPSLHRLCIVPKSSINANSVGISVHVSFQHEPKPQHYHYVQSASSKILAFSYSASSHDSDTSPTFFPPFAIWGNITTKISVTSEVFLEGNTIRITTDTTCFMHLNSEGGVSEGNLRAYASEIKYVIGADNTGKLTVTQGKPSFKDNSHFDTSAWSQFLSMGEIDGLVKNLENFWSVMKNFMTGQQREIGLLINSSNYWSFPLGQLYRFEHVAFDSSQDLAADAIQK